MFLDSLYLIRVESCGLIKSMSFRHFWWGLGNGSRSNGDNSYYYPTELNSSWIMD
jgi:hypothetical protein